MSASKMAVKRLGKEHQAFQKDPPPFIWARPNESNILEWHAIFRGPPDTPYHGGEYWAVVTFTKDYPFAPPELKMLTPSGRFTPNTAICTSMSNFHPGSWNVSWSIETILVGLLSFMLSEEITTGKSSCATQAPDSERRALAAASHAWNISQPKFRTIFPEYATKDMRDVPNMSGQAPKPAGPQGEGTKPLVNVQARAGAAQGGAGERSNRLVVVVAAASAAVLVAVVAWWVMQ
ncbi:uncharacterized protein RHOBADRAFT_47688 [Rhodotorula graminis WP1]|uniref:UBC core domain-containing protein n=1 Tax=Rhodotorula graminis (strain WP1) TaxID=578459 RepID=A0A0N8PZ71_RHOGW|nr:uncharacterized protein RHOBADRAFT_47688 [Rhodotorula graminis WP1]KPV71509.1 hypothetical protein RHOBADRAFT_47688 [Rhodotorula graminis WP1]